MEQATEQAIRLVETSGLEPPTPAYKARPVAPGS
jgi:hypothetical protein